ncbi:hypothetical protein FB45DRAFT_1038029 [Roridomyces roridus]|uniref:Uncharacterized protein n=1 Tax=Roridomyces roridus TaxID=1738132 RepID=A0AAD7FBP9_9AGAR|nr:hypothetical protein FB45DRAFT_1038029 [Roridomyces roridus]
MTVHVDRGDRVESLHPRGDRFESIGGKESDCLDWTSLLPRPPYASVSALPQRRIPAIRVEAKTPSHSHRHDIHVITLCSRWSNKHLAALVRRSSKPASSTARTPSPSQLHACGGKQAFRALLRSEALGSLQTYWHGDDARWTSEPPTAQPYIYSSGVNTAAFIGALFRVGVFTAEDVHECLVVLVPPTQTQADLELMSLMAMHALLDHCGTAICEGQSGIEVNNFVESVRVAHAGKWEWNPLEPRAALFQDLVEMLGRWTSSVEVTQIRAAAAAVSF